MARSSHNLSLFVNGALRSKNGAAEEISTTSQVSGDRNALMASELKAHLAKLAQQEDSALVPPSGAQYAEISFSMSGHWSLPAADADWCQMSKT
uniref:Uncharacterized protein n=1 Tax=Candidatus Kentrum sp. MB TaxID=2138164 RepID=A0A451B8V9_9GAMM|nr:MAG: hypothetical protein BECKMB1821G_GA0114241_101313 [Candidatus Kentron sp. MB]VFK29166.1 MAG: hypothetical protein BECKMB1821I_GA0114274_100862 [Candidatus Kentron sp. MB]VFK74702.1 MAG: hypothetical protein BECKMB1821H_GA0114242_100861 [Candidatus Kentron sp. MB]